MIQIKLNLNMEKWDQFKRICREEGENPDRVLQKWIDEYTKKKSLRKKRKPTKKPVKSGLLSKSKNSPEYRLAKSIVEAENILAGKAKGIDAYKLLKEL